MSNLISKGFRSLFQVGFRATWSKVKGKLCYRRKTPLYTKKELDAQRQTVFDRPLRFSILVPLYNTPEVFLRQMIASVLAQTYPQWELCLADGSDEKHGYVGSVCRQFQDQRIRYKKLPENLGISGNTNACLELATGEYIVLLDHDDLLHPGALFALRKAIHDTGADMLYNDEATFCTDPKKRCFPYHKPDYAPDTLRSYNYICHLLAFQRVLFDRVGLFRPEFDGSQDYDLVLRLTEQAKHIVHIPQILYFWRIHAGSVASGVAAKPYAIAAAKRAIAQHLERLGLTGAVEDAAVPSTYRIRYALEGTPLISILIPSCDHAEDLSKCVATILEKTTYPNYEILIIENNSRQEKTFAAYQRLCRDPRIRVVTWEREFNYSAINNFGAAFARGEYLLLLNNDMEVIDPDWLQQMLMYAQRSDVGAVGAMLYYGDDTIQHAGVILGIGGVAGHGHKHFPRGSSGYMSRAAIAQNLSCVTGACLLMRRAVWDEVGGLDEGFAVAFNDVDLCMRLRKAGYLIVWTPYAQLYHHESKSRGAENTKEKQLRFAGEVARFQQRWEKELAAGDPYYNPNLTLQREDFRLK